MNWKNFQMSQRVKIVTRPWKPRKFSSEELLKACADARKEGAVGVKKMKKTYADECLERADQFNQEHWQSVAIIIANYQTDVKELARRLKRACHVLREITPQYWPDWQYRNLANELEAIPEEK